MTPYQRFLRTFYPFIKIYASITGKSKQYRKSPVVTPPVSFYSLTAVFKNEQVFHFDTLRNKPVLIVNTASDCGFTAQYKGLRELLVQYPNLHLLIFPSNDFNNQEPGSDNEIEDFCRLSFDIHSPIFKKSVVTKRPECNEIFRWLTSSNYNGWNNEAPSWNFNKYLIDKEGRLICIFSQFTDPLHSTLIEHLSCFS